MLQFTSPAHNCGPMSPPFHIRETALNHPFGRKCAAGGGVDSCLECMNDERNKRVRSEAAGANYATLGKARSVSSPAPYSEGSCSSPRGNSLTNISLFIATEIYIE
jgi:hypothetical protein